MKKTHHQIIVALVALLAFGGPALAQPPKPPKPSKPSSSERGGSRVEEVERQTFRVPNVTQLDLSNISGDIVVTAGGGSDAVIEVVKRGFGDSREEARRQLSYLDVRLHIGEGGRGTVRADYGSAERQRQNYRSSADFTVTAPAGTAIFAKSISGNLRASGMTGELSAESVSGNIRLDAPARVSTAKSVSGDVEVSRATLEGTLTASSVSGTVRLQSIKARRVDASSVSGDIVLTDVACERASLETVSGDVEYAGSISKGGRYELQAHSGDITFTARGNAGFDVDATSYSGQIRSELPITNVVAETLKGERKRRPGPRRDTFRGTYGDGSATVELSTFSGDIVIRK